MTDLVNRRPAGFDYDFRPASYFEDVDLKSIVLASISVRARRDHASAAGIAYLVVDEYGTEYQLVQERSAQPLTLGELIDLINTTVRDDNEITGGLAISHVVWHCEQGMGEGMRGFVRVESAFYPELNRFYDAVLDGYLDELDEVLRKEREGEEQEYEEEFTSGTLDASC